MNVESLQVTQEQAVEAVKAYRAGRERHDALDKEILRIYRAIAAGKTVISVHDAIRAAGVDEFGRPRLAIMRADQEAVRCDAWHSEKVTFMSQMRSTAADLKFEIAWPNRAKTGVFNSLWALLPRIPPQYRPAVLSDYHLLWEADWTAIPRDPYLLKRLGKDAWAVVAAWDLTSVEMNVLRARSDVNASR